MKKLFVFGLMAAVLPAFAEEAADRKTATSLKYVEHELDTRQNKFTAEQNKAMEYTDSAGIVQQRTVKSDLGSNTSDTSLPMVGGVNTKLATKQDDIAAVNDHTAITYTGQPGGIGQKGIYQTSESYVEQSNNLIDAKTFNAALKRGLDSEFLCSEYKPGTDLCWVWAIHNNGPKNLYDPATNPIEQGNINTSDGQPSSNYGEKRVRTGFINVEPNTQYTISSGGLPYIFVYQYRSDETYLSGNAIWWHASPSTFTTSQSTGKIRILLANGANADSSTNITPSDLLWLKVEVGPYQDVPYTTLVPAGYTPVEFIQSNGTQYINTGITDVTNSEFTLVAQQTELLSGYPTLLGAMDGGDFKVVFAYGSTSHFYTQTGAGDGNYVLSSNQDINKHTFNLLTVGNVHTFTIDNATVIGNYQPVATTTYPLFLCARNRAGTVGNQVKQKVFSFSAKKNGALIQNLIPARRNRDDVVGMYDTVSGEFLTSVPANTNFTAGPDVNNIIYVPQNQ